MKDSKRSQGDVTPLKPSSMKQKFKQTLVPITEDPSKSHLSKVMSGLALKLREILDNTSWSEQDIAKALGIPQSRVSTLTKERINSLSFVTVIRFFEKLGYDVSFNIKSEKPSKHPKL